MSVFVKCNTITSAAYYKSNNARGDKNAEFLHARVRKGGGLSHFIVLPRSNRGGFPPRSVGGGDRDAYAYCLRISVFVQVVERSFAK